MIDFNSPIEFSDGTPATALPVLTTDGEGIRRVRADKLPEGLTIPLDLLTSQRGVVVFPTGHIAGSDEYPDWPTVRNRATAAVAASNPTVTATSAVEASAAAAARAASNPTVTVEKGTTGPAKKPTTLYEAINEPTFSGELLGFRIVKGAINIGAAPLARKFSKTVLIQNSTRAKVKTDEQHGAFDQFVFDLRSKKADVRYIDDLKSIFDPKAQFEAFLAGKPTIAVLTADQQRLPALLAEVKKAFEDQLAPTPTVYERSSRPVKNLLKVQGNNVSNGSYSITLAQAKALWNIAYPLWLKAGADAKGSLGYSRERVKAIGTYTQYRPTISGQNITIGCQRIPREKVEQLAVAQGWLKV